MKATPTLPIIMQKLNSPIMKSIQLMRNSKDSSGSTQIIYSMKKKQQGDAVKHA